MKALIALALNLTLLAGFTAHASDIASPVPVARVQMSLGMFVGNLASREITLFSDGSSKVVELRAERDAETGQETGRKSVEFNSDYYFEADVMAKIAAASLLQTGGALVDVDSESPVCEDGPGFQYYVLQAGKTLKIATNFGCHVSLPADKKLQRSAKYLKADLDNLFKAIEAEQSPN